eukprot:TRINITY_DN6544_c0_g1_i1.p2 TRINITY_DN6544_c0_g1~~TRINITY_DN6544_c0_g1_i1.p2  ORF type:complete len:106 (-),score=14.72 TRINITY_DN6544_c0_g1_i1:242-559(-)
MYASGMATQSLAELAEERQAAEDKLSEEVTRGVQTETAMMESVLMVKTAGYIDDVVNEAGLQNDTNNPFHWICSSKSPCSCSIGGYCGSWNWGDPEVGSKFLCEQ